jgi:hypothetical protein
LRECLTIAILGNREFIEAVSNPEMKPMGIFPVANIF